MNNLGRKRAIFWDNDGVLVDTEKYYYEANRQILEKADFLLTKALYIELFLVLGKGAWHLLDPLKYSSEMIHKFREERDEIYLKFLQSGNLKIDGVEEVLANMVNRYRMAIVTSSSPLHFNTIHSRTGLLKYFEFVITPQDYKHYKPNPEPYQLAISRMGIAKDEGIAIEDSRRGLLSAKAAGLDCIILKNELTETSEFPEADFVYSDIHCLNDIL